MPPPLPKQAIHRAWAAALSNPDGRAPPSLELPIAGDAPAAHLVPEPSDSDSAAVRPCRRPVRDFCQEPLEWFPFCIPQSIPQYTPHPELGRNLTDQIRTRFQNRFNRLLKNSRMPALPWKSGPSGPRQPFRIGWALAPVVVFNPKERVLQQPVRGRGPALQFVEELNSAGVQPRRSGPGR